MSGCSWLGRSGQRPASHFPAVEWQEFRLQGQEWLAERASKKLKNDGLLITSMAGAVLRFEIDQVPLWRGNHVGVKQLVDDFAKYLYLPRVKNAQVILDAIQDGASRLTWSQDTFAYADYYDAATRTISRPRSWSPPDCPVERQQRCREAGRCRRADREGFRAATATATIRRRVSAQYRDRRDKWSAGIAGEQTGGTGTGMPALELEGASPAPVPRFRQDRRHAAVPRCRCDRQLGGPAPRRSAGCKSENHNGDRSGDPVRRAGQRRSNGY